MNSIWEENVKNKPRKTLDKDIKTTVAIVGGGIAGILCAYMLINKGINDVVIIEANSLLSGQTKNTTAKITSQHGFCYDKLIKKHGLDKARLYAKANEKAIENYRIIIERENIDCDFKNARAYLYSVDCEDKILSEARAYEKVGLLSHITTRTELPFEVKCSLFLENQACFNPLKFLNQLSQNITVYENTKVLSAESRKLVTNRGEIRADYIVFACHYPFVNAPGYYFTRIHQERSYVLQLGNVPTIENMYIGVGSISNSFREYKGNLLFGGESHRTGENKAADKYARLIKSAKSFYPDCTVVRKWSAQDCIPADGIPYIGKYSKSRENWYIATAFKKWGMTSAMIASDIISDKITGVKNKFAACFTPQRSIICAVPQIVKDGLKSVKSIAKQNLYIPKSRVSDIKRGHGGIILYNGEKTGVYKDENGKVFCVSTRCPHLGCCLEWNGDEKSWDCPCHGSRYDYKGNIINSPAQKDNIQTK